MKVTFFSNFNFAEKWEFAWMVYVALFGETVTNQFLSYI